MPLARPILLLAATAPLARGDISSSYQLPARLRTIFDLVLPESASCADIGADHGILSAALSTKAQHVYATDLSPAAAARANRLFAKLGIEGRLSLEVGFGLRPLLSRGLRVDSVVLSGMGAQAALQILTDDPSARFDDTDDVSCWRDVDYGRFNLQALDALGVRQLLLQPWPPNILPVHYLTKLLLLNGWRHHAQRITASEGRRNGNEYHHLVSSFVRGSSTECVTDEWVFNHSPLHLSYTRNELDEEERACWAAYLDKQSESLQKRMLAALSDDCLPGTLLKLIKNN